MCIPSYHFNSNTNLYLYKVQICTYNQLNDGKFNLWDTSRLSYLVNDMKTSAMHIGMYFYTPRSVCLLT